LLAPALVLAAAVVLVAWPRPPALSPRDPAVGAATLPEPVAPAFVPDAPRLLGPQTHVSHWAAVLRAVEARSEPRRGAPRVAPLEMRTPEGTTNIALVTATAEDASGRRWSEVRLSALPNDLTGWVPRSALGGYVSVNTRLVVDRERLTATLYRGGRRVFRARVGIGRPEWPTPAGEFYIRNRLEGFDSPAYGPLAFGTSARSAVLTDWPAGGFVGIHGTDQPELLPGRVSHGCIRLSNEDIVELARLMPVGTPLTIR
jgi:hypothetical protein